MRKHTFVAPLDRVFITSDNHFGHRFLSELRRFRSREDHDETLIRRWNETVGPCDSVLCLGDFSFRNVEETRSIVNRLNGDIWIIPGNHDDTKRLEKWFSGQVLPQLMNVKVVDGDDSFRFEACHYPLASWNGSDKGAVHLHGHLHSKNNKNVENHFCAPYSGAGIRLDVGIDNAAWFGYNLSPIPISVMKSYCEKNARKPIDYNQARWDKYLVDPEQ